MPTVAPPMLSAQVSGLCLGLAGRLTGSAAAAARAISTTCSGPLVVAVAGRVNAGKSTVVNALMGQRVARTDSRECTTLVTVFRHGPSESVQLVRRDGDRREFPLDADGMIPADIPAGPDVARIEVTLANRNLDGVTVVDTPGLASAHTENSRRTTEFLGLAADDPASVGAVERASAALYVFTQAFREDDLEAVRGFRSITARVGSSPANAVGVLNKADKIGDGRSLDAAQRLAAGQTVALRRELSTVLPLVGLLGETVEAGRFTQGHADALRAIAGLREGERKLLLFSADRFVTTDVGVPREVREQLLARLDLFGIQTALDQVAAGGGAEELRTALLRASGLGALRQLVDVRFRARADALKAADALGQLSRLAATSPDPEARRAVAAEVERFLLQPQAHALAELAIGTELATGSVTLPERLADDANRLLNGDTVGARLNLPATAGTTELATAAGETANRWRMFANTGASPAQARVAMVLHRSAALLYTGLAAGGAGAS